MDTTRPQAPHAAPSPVREVMVIRHKGTTEMWTAGVRHDLRNSRVRPLIDVLGSVLDKMAAESRAGADPWRRVEAPLPQYVELSADELALLRLQLTDSLPTQGATSA